MNVQRHITAMAISSGIGLFVFVVCVFAIGVAAIAAAFLGSQSAVKLWEVLVEFPIRILHLPLNGAFYAAMAWALVSMVITYVLVLWKLRRREMNGESSDEVPKSAV